MDSRDDDPWTPADTEDLQGVIARGGSIEEAAELLCRSGTIDQVAAKAAELGLLNAKNSG